MMRSIAMEDLVTRLRQRLGDAWKLNDEAADEIERLRSALEFYAHEFVWNEDSDDKGEVAREALR